MTRNRLVASSNLRGSQFFFKTNLRLISNFLLLFIELLFVVFSQVFAKQSFASVSKYFYHCK